MSMIVPLEITGELEGQLREGIAAHDVARVRQVLLAAVEPAAEALVRPPAGQDEREPLGQFFDRLADEVAGYLGPDHQPLSDYAVSRESFYEDHD